MTERLSDNPLPARYAAVTENLKRIRFEIEEAAAESGRDPSDILLLAATKTVPAQVINHAVSLGVRAIGENRVQEFLEKEPHLTLDGVAVHFIGNLQTNKVSKLIPSVRMIQSLNSARLAREIARCSKIAGVVTDVLIEVNVGDEKEKIGIDPAAVSELAAEIDEIDGISLRGLMTIPPISDDIIQTRKYFEEIYKLYIDISAEKKDNRSIDILSMGMSGDFREAVLEGSNLLRIGTALFGNR